MTEQEKNKPFEPGSAKILCVGSTSDGVLRAIRGISESIPKGVDVISEATGETVMTLYPPEEKSEPFKNATVEKFGHAVYDIPDIMAEEIVKAYNEWLSNGASFVPPKGHLVLFGKAYTLEEKAFRDKHKLTLCGE